MTDQDAKDADWDEETVEDFVRKMESENKSENGGSSQPPNNPNTGIIWTGLVLFGLIVYSAYNGMHTFTLWVTLMLLVLALGNKAIRQMIGRTTWVDYIETDEYDILVRLSARLANGEKFNGYVKGTEPYIFAPYDESTPDKEYLVGVERGYESLFGHRLKKIITETPKQAGGLTDDFSWTGEADVPYYRRVSIQDGLSGYIDIPEIEDFHNKKPLIDISDIDVNPDFVDVINPRISIADIEVHVPENDSFDEMQENASEPINVICSYDTYEEDYSVFFYNKYGGLDASEIRLKMGDQLADTDIQEYTNASVELIQADTEEDMLNEYIQYVENRGFDLVSGWNYVDFDHRYIIDRMQKLWDETDDPLVHPAWLSPFDDKKGSRNQKMRIPGLPAFDMMEGFCDKLTFSNWRSQSLEYVSNEELGIGKIDDVDINEDWKNNPSRLIAYNIVDVILTVALDDANDIHSFFYEMADACSIPIYDVFYEKRQVDGYVMSNRGDNEILPTTEESESIDNAGGFVADPANGRIQNVGVSDLKSLYPSAMITWNISTETVAETPEDFDKYVKIPKVPEPKKVDGEIEEGQIDFDWLYASLDEEGIIPRSVKQLFKKRNREKAQMYEADPDSAEHDKWDRKQGATKVLMNSFYGVSSSVYWRLSNQHLGDAVTSAARYTLWKGKQTLKRLDVEHIYSDTDSHFLQLTEDTPEARVEELKMISEEMDSDASEILEDCGYGEEHPFLIDSDLHGDKYTCMMWEAEKTIENFMQLDKKKRYAMNLEWKEGKYHENPKISISGFENQRSDSMPATADLQEEVIEMVLTGAEFEEVSEYLQSVIGEINERNPDVERFALPGSINKDLEDYPNRQIPRASMWSNEHLDKDFGDGDDPFVYLVQDTPPSLPQTDVVALEWNDEIPEGFELDREAIIERGIKKPLETIVKEVGWEFNELRSGQKQQTRDFGSGNPFA